MGGPFSTNLRKLQRSKSSGGAGHDHAVDMLKLTRSQSTRDWIFTPQGAATYFGSLVAICAVLYWSIS